MFWSRLNLTCSEVAEHARDLNKALQYSSLCPIKQFSNATTRLLQEAKEIDPERYVPHYQRLLREHRITQEIFEEMKELGDGLERRADELARELMEREQVDGRGDDRN